jgi:PAS domain S-box-containing protein
LNGYRARLPAKALPDDERPVEILRTASSRLPLRLVLVAGLLPLVLLGATFLRMLSVERTTAIEEMLEQSAVAAEMAISLYVGQETGRLEGLAASSSIDTGDWIAFRIEARRLLDRHPHWLNIIVTDDSRQVFNERLGTGQPLPPVRDLDSVRAVWESSRPVVGNLAPGVNGALGAAFRVPVIREGHVRYTLVAPAAPTLFSRVLREQKLPAGWTAVVIDANGIVVGHSADPDTTVGKPVGMPLAEPLRGAGTMTGTVSIPDGTDYRIAVAAAVAPGWRVAVMAPASLVGAPARFGEYAVWGAVAGVVVLAVVLIGALLSAVTSRRTLDNLSRLHARAVAGEAALARSEAQFRTLAESMPALLFVTNSAGANIYTNPRFQEYCGLRAQDLLGTGWNAVVHPEDRERTACVWDRAVQSGTIYEAEHRFRRSDGAWRWFLCRAIPQRNDDGNIERWVGTCTDIQAMKEAEERLHLLMREVDHRAKNALAVVQSILYLSRADDPATFAEAVEGRINAMARVHSLLSASRWSGVMLGDLIAQELAAFSGCSRLDIQGPVLALRPEAAQAVALVLHELATNAAKYGALATDGGRLAVTWSIGHDPQELTLVWREEGGPAIVEPPQGRGFGMVLIEQVVGRQLNGRLALDWHRAGLCCTMAYPEVCFTVGGVVGAPADFAPVTATSPAPLSGHSILVVEDEAITALAVAQALEQAGFTVIGPAARVGEAIDLLRTNLPDAAMLDLSLFGSSAHPIAEALRNRGIPFLFCTGYQDLNHTAGMMDDVPVLSKPVSAGKLIDALTKLIAHSPAVNARAV